MLMIISNPLLHVQPFREVVSTPHLLFPYFATLCGLHGSA